MILPVLSKSLSAIGFLVFLSSFAQPVRGQTDLSRISQEDMKTVEQRADLLTAAPGAHDHDGQINNWTAGLEGLFQKAEIPLPAFGPSWERLMGAAAQRDQAYPNQKTIFGNTFSQMLPHRLGATGAYRDTTERLVSMAFGLVNEAARHGLTLSLDGLILSLDPLNASASALYNPLYGWTAKTLVLVSEHHTMLRFNGGGMSEEDALVVLMQGGSGAGDDEDRALREAIALSLGEGQGGMVPSGGGGAW
jgi:hypothetical protein